MDYILNKLEPTLFPEEQPEDAWFRADKIDLLCFALRVQKSTSLPHVTHEVDDTFEDVAAALSQHYLNIGKPLTIPPKTPEQLLEGYYHLESDKVYTCTLDSKDQKTRIDFSYADSVALENPLNHQSSVTLTMGGRDSKVDTMHVEFAQDGVEFPDQEADWQGDFFGREKVVVPTTPAKRQKLAQQQDDGTAPKSSSGPSSGVLSAALRRRLAEKRNDEKK